MRHLWLLHSSSSSSEMTPAWTLGGMAIVYVFHSWLIILSLLILLHFSPFWVSELIAIDFKWNFTDDGGEMQ